MTAWGGGVEGMKAGARSSSLPVSGDSGAQGREVATWGMGLVASERG